jgi:hypothetical protein
MISVAVVITHQKNIERLLSNKESRVKLFSKKTQPETKSEQLNSELKVE